MSDQQLNPVAVKLFKQVGFALLAIVIFTSVLNMGIMPWYRIYHQHMEGRAMLSKSEYSKQVLVQEAKALDEAAKYKADADITQAKGAAEAIKILGDSLKANPDYIRYKFVENLEIGDHDTIYLPTEAGIPILESQRLTMERRTKDKRPLEERQHPAEDQ